MGAEILCQHGIRSESSFIVYFQTLQQVDNHHINICFIDLTGNIQIRDVKLLKSAGQIAGLLDVWCDMIFELLKQRASQHFLLDRLFYLVRDKYGIVFNPVKKNTEDKLQAIKFSVAELQVQFICHMPNGGTYFVFVAIHMKKF